MDWLPIETIDGSPWLNKLIPLFSAHYKNTLPVINKVFCRQMESKKQPDICVFALGYMTVEDFMEALLLSCHGYGLGGLKILRAMYEHHVTASYLAKFPEETSAFVNYEYITTRKFFRRAAEFKDLEPMLQSMGGQEVRQENEQNAANVEKNYVTEICKECHATGPQPSWSKLPTDAMARKVSAGLYGLYGPYFLVPTWHLHTSFHAIASRQNPENGELKFDRPPDDYIQQALLSVDTLLVEALKLQESYFDLGLQRDIEAVKCSSDETWAHLIADVKNQS